jgi:hypothetical protein
MRASPLTWRFGQAMCLTLSRSEVGELRGNVDEQILLAVKELKLLAFQVFKAYVWGRLRKDRVERLG